VVLVMQCFYWVHPTTFEGDAMSVKEFMEYNAKLNKIYEDWLFRRESKLETRL
jgi:hypothetical protein